MFFNFKTIYMPKMFILCPVLNGDILTFNLTVVAALLKTFKNQRRISLKDLISKELLKHAEATLEVGI